MRLERVERGHRFGEKLILAVVGLLVRGRAPDILRALLYRPEIFGRTANAWTHAAMRGPSLWSVGERELFAAFTSRRNNCPF